MSDSSEAQVKVQITQTLKSVNDDDWIWKKCDFGILIFKGTLFEPKEYVSNEVGARIWFG